MADQRYTVRGTLRQDTSNPMVLRLQPGAEPSADDVVVGQLENAALAEFLCEAHNAYVPAMRALAALPHSAAIPEWWRNDSRAQPLSLTDVVALLCEHLPRNSVGAP